MQALRVAASASVLSILHFVTPHGSQRGPTYQTAVRNFAFLRPPLAYTVIKDRKQVEYNFTAIIRARVRCAPPMSKKFPPRLHGCKSLRSGDGRGRFIRRLGHSSSTACLGYDRPEVGWQKAR